MAGGHLVVSHPLGRRWHEGLRAGSDNMVPHALPDRAALAELAAGLPMTLESCVDDADLYLALLRVRRSTWGCDNAFCASLPVT